jgi:hypothetical protein
MHGMILSVLMRRRFVLALLASGVLLVDTGAVSAQPMVFDVRILGHITRPSGGCPDGASLCGQTTLDGFGPAAYSIVFTEFVPTFAACGDYTATVTFTPDDGSGVLTLDEVGVACGAGPTFLKGPFLGNYGNPRSWSGTWQVLDGTGSFAGLTGNGADTGLTAGAAVKATYRGTLSPQ